MEETITDWVCTRCVRDLNLNPLLKWGGDGVTRCDVCENYHRCCFRLERFISSTIDDETRYGYYPLNTKKRFIDCDKKQMWEYGVEYKMGFTLYVICYNMRTDGIDVPVEIVRFIYGLAKQIPLRRRRF